MTAWDDTLAAALLGTARRRAPTASAGGRLGAMLEQVAGRAPEGALLATAGALAVYLRAGERAAPASAEPDAPSAPDPRPATPSLAADYLRVVLAGDYAQLLEEWVREAAARGWRAPADAPPRLLAEGSEWPEIQAAVSDLAGPRGVWLAERNAGWGWLLGARAGDDPEALADRWRTGDPSEREALLAALRGRDPDTARDLLASTFAKEDGAVRADLLAALQTGLSPADEPFLTTALNDRRRAVRETAARLLGGLPGSAFAQRIAAAAEPVLELAGGLRKRIDVHPPDALDPDLGLDAKAPRGTGERSHWLQLLVAHAPLATWTAKLGLDPDAIAATKIERGWSYELRSAWAAAAAAQRDTAWARALAPHTGDGALLALLPKDERERIVAGRVDRGAEVDLPYGDEPWGEPLSSALIARLADRGGSLEDVVSALHPSTLDGAQAALERLATRRDYATRDAPRALRLLAFRRGMLAALTEEPE